MARRRREGIASMSLRAWPIDFPGDIAVQRRVPYESHADSIMYRQVLAELAHASGWEVHLYDARKVEDEVVRLLGERADEVLHGPRATLGPPWSKDHRMALAATVARGDRPMRFDRSLPDWRGVHRDQTNGPSRPPSRRPLGGP